VNGPHAWLRAARLFSILSFAGPTLASAQGYVTINMFGSSNVDLSMVWENVVGTLVSVASPIIIAVFLYGAFLTVTGAGKEDLSKRGKSIMIGAAIGLGIIMGSYAMMRMVYYVIY